MKDNHPEHSPSQRNIPDDEQTNMEDLHVIEIDDAETSNVDMLHGIRGKEKQNQDNLLQKECVETQNVDNVHDD